MDEMEFLLNPERYERPGRQRERGRGGRGGAFDDRGGGGRGRRGGAFDDRGGAGRGRRGGAFDDRGGGGRGRRGGAFENRDGRGGRDGAFGDRGGRDGAFGNRVGRDGAFGDRGGRDGAFENRDGRDGAFGNRGGRGGAFGNRGGRDGAFGNRGGRGAGFRGIGRGEGGHFEDRGERNDEFRRENRRNIVLQFRGGNEVDNLVRPRAGREVEDQIPVEGGHDNFNNWERPRRELQGAMPDVPQENGGQRRNFDRLRFTPKVRDLEDLKAMDDHDLLIAVAAADSRLLAAMHNCGTEKHSISPNHIPLIFDILARVSKCTHSNQMLNNFLLNVLETPFFERRLQQLVTYEMMQILQRRSWNIEVGRKCLHDLIETLTALLERIEHQAYEKLHLIVIGIESLIRTFQSLKINGESLICEETMTLHEELLQLHTSATVKQLTIMENEHEEQNVEPPDNFRDFEIVPSKEELDKNNDSVFLLANIVEGKYRSVDDYLDVQFRLMREDFVIPLRTGINEYRDLRVQLGQKKRITEIRVYPNVRVVHPCCLQTGIGYVVQLDTAKQGKRKIMWEKSKRLLYGSLVSFWNEDFTSVIFAVVEDRQVETLSQWGQFVVKFVNTRNVDELVSQNYVMIESAAYFEAYKHVLKRLKDITADSLPFVNHLVECEPIVQPPNYLSRDLTRRYDFRCLLVKEEGAPEILEIEPLNIRKWPTAEDLGMDPSQHLALQNAVTKRLALIQGPPGTGKTFIGLKIAQLLLKNVIEPSQGRLGPMLLVCYTNHALDQFLEGISKFKGNKIVRVGGRSRSPALKKFAMSSIRLEYIRGRSFPADLRRQVGQCKGQMENLQRTLSEQSARLKSTKEHLISAECLEEYMSDVHIDSLFRNARNRSDKNDKLKAWLLGFSRDEFEFAPEVEESIDELAEILLWEAMTEETVVVVRQHLMLELGEEEEENIMFQDEADFENAQRRLDEEEYGNVGDALKEIDAHSKRMLQTEFVDLGPDVDFGTETDDWQMVRPNNKSLRRLIRRELEHEDRMTQEEEEQVAIPMHLHWRQKWRLYRLWRYRYQRRVKETIQKYSNEYDNTCERHRELRAHVDRVVMAAQEVIAMTTTGAARYGDMLNIIQPRIIIVEEAAEVFESHVVASLSAGTQHLILIGDHKQLRPSPAVYKLAKKYSLDISLFERFIRNKFQHDTLGLQHRMRPEISSLVRHSGIYPELGDHPSVRQYPVVTGISHNVFFVDHKHLENNCTEIQSYSNDFEAQFAIRLCRHLLMQGYSAEQITVLTLYSGQLFLLKNVIKGKYLQGLNVTVVDNYQGEENDIIILSLVRSNADNKIGFVGIDNRICVALSRARMGLYVIGNFSLMAQKSTLWSRVVELVRAEDQIGEGLNLVCQMHPESESVIVKSVADFDKLAPEGGCQKVCGKRLKCGHVCVKFCHPSDRDHKQYQCRQPCGRLCARNLHECTRFCYKSCAKCEVLIETEIPSCGHIVNIPCSMNARDVKCPEKCSFVLACGHRCANKCGEGHTVQCCAPVQKVSPFCGHTVKAPCWCPITSMVCRKPCRKTLKCGHTCSGTCGECAEGRIHRPCTSPCERTLVCGHPCRFPCTRNCPPCDRKCEFKCEHAPCEDLCGTSCIKCRMVCPNRCNHGRCKRMCHQMCDKSPCDQPCKKRFHCKKCNRNYQCPSVCGELCIELCRQCDADELTEIFFGTEDEPDALFIRLMTCMHIFEVTGLDQWMSMEKDEGAIKAKTCPKCKTPITMSSCRRYYDLCRENIRIVQEVKQKVNNEESQFERKMEQLRMNLDLTSFNSLNEMIDPRLNNNIRLKMSKCRFMIDFVVCQNAFLIGQRLDKIARKFLILSHERLHWRKIPEEMIDRLKHNITGIINCFNYDFVTQTEMDQCATETRRVGDMVSIIALFVEYHKSYKPQKEPFLQTLENIWKLCVVEESYTEEISRGIVNRLQKVGTELHCGLNISEQERVEIVQAMGLAQGHWYRCPNNHVYAIGDCGRPNQASRCPECGSSIGGTGYQLSGGNAPANEMLGAIRPRNPFFLT